MDHMARALSLARRALGSVSPNPAVGAVVVKGGATIGEGFTQPPGSAHAEIVALREAGEAARGATMCVTLEPCCHYGRTPPCTMAIIEAGISEVHVATLDPNPRVAGRGVAELRAAGIATVVGEHEEEARELNEAYMKWITTGRPFVNAKFAMSLDGKIATRSGDSRWITGERSRAFVHRLRSQVDAVMVGAGTVLADDPQLTARYGGSRPMPRQPLRVVVDAQGRISPSARLFGEPGRTMVATTSRLDDTTADILRVVGAEVLPLPEREGLVDLEALLQALGQREVTSVLVEGGAAILGSLFDARLVDKVYAFIAPIIIGGKDAVPAVGGRGVEHMTDALRLRGVRVQQFGGDVLVWGYPERSEE